jgi:excisionase family DNA binding protein
MMGVLSPVEAPDGARAMSKIALSREEAADALSVDVQTIDRMIKAKELHASKLRRRVVIRVVDIERLLDTHAA